MTDTEPQAELEPRDAPEQLSGTTASGLPYPSDTDAVMLGAQNIKALADAIDRRFRIVSISVDIPSTAAHTSSLNIVVPIAGLAVGDHCFWVGAQGTAGVSFHGRTRGPCTTAGQIQLDLYNADPATNDPGATVHHFLVVAHA